jgi:hypothetical protein
MHFGLWNAMNSQLIEGLLKNELKGLCINCVLVSSCLFRKTTDRIIIQCELFQVDDEADVLHPVSMQKSLCMNCARNNSCQLPGRRTGVWHCEEYL